LPRPVGGGARDVLRRVAAARLEHGRDCRSGRCGSAHGAICSSQQRAAPAPQVPRALLPWRIEIRNGVIPAAPAPAPVPDTATMDANGLAHRIGAR